MERWWGNEHTQRSPYFTVHQIFESRFRRILSHLGAATETEKTRIDTVPGADDRTVVSAEPWSVVAVSGPRARAVYVFRNTASSQSPRLIAHRFGDVKLKVAAGANVGADVGVATAGVNGSGELGTTVITAIDPIVRVRLLLPWERDELSLDAYVKEQFEAIHDVDTGEAMAAFRDVLAPELPREIPEGWSFVSPPGRTVMEGEAADFSIGVGAQTPGRTLFAIEVQEVGNAENVACSELMELEVTDDLEIVVHYDTEPAGAAPAAASA
jgi:hypothetical protein